MSYLQLLAADIVSRVHQSPDSKSNLAQVVENMLGDLVQKKELDALIRERQTASMQWEQWRKKAQAHERVIETIKAHECACFSCDRDGEEFCDCLERVMKGI